jgi:membrane-associated protease RseP (regulator of RpoE activity)
MQNSPTPLIALLGTLILLAWSFARAYSYGKLGILAWCQQILLAIPWLIYFGAWLLQYSLSLAMLLLLLALSTVGYVFLGYQIRQLVENIPYQTANYLSPKSLSTSPDSIQSNSQTPAASQIPDKINASDLQLIQGIFGIETFYATETLPQRGGGVVFKGNLRGEPAAVYQRLSKALGDRRDRLTKKYQFFLVEDEKGRPLVYMLPVNAELEKISNSQKILSFVLFAVNLLTTAILGGELQNFDLMSEPHRWYQTLTFVVGVSSILAVRELAQRWTAKKYQIRLTPPFCLPSSQIATFGAFSRVKTAIPSRKALFDLAIAPAIASGVFSLILLIVGLVLSKNQISNSGFLPEIPSQIFQYSVFVGLIAKVILGTSLRLDLVSLHFLVIVGWLGLTITALNLMPAGQLDGGRIVQAIYGRKTAAATTLLTLLFLVVAALVNPTSLYWAGIILILLREQERPMLNEISELDRDRDALGLGMLFWMILIILPMTSQVAQSLGIG